MINLLRFSRHDEPVTVTCPECGEEYQTRVTREDGTAPRCRKCFQSAQRRSIREWQRKIQDERLKNIPHWLMERGLPKRHCEASFEICFNGRRPQELPCLLTGPAGTGKTTLAACFFREFALTLGFESVLFLKETDLVQALRDSEGGRADILEAAKRVHFLVLDDMGKATPTPFIREQIFHLLDHRHSEELRTIITTNLSLNDFCRTYGSNHAEALLSRLSEMGKTLVFRGRDRRMAKTTGPEPRKGAPE